MDICGIYVITSRMAIMTAHMGSINLTIFVKGVSDMLEDTNSVIPTGGVLMPIARFTVVMIPKCTGFTPYCCTRGRSMGTARIIAGVESKKVPRTRKIMFTMISMSILLLMEEPKTEATFMGIC